LQRLCHRLTASPGSGKIVHEVSKRGVKINFLWLRLYVIKYMHQYKKMTKEETGKESIRIAWSGLLPFSLIKNTNL